METLFRAVLQALPSVCFPRDALSKWRVQQQQHHSPCLITTRGARCLNPVFALAFLLLLFPLHRFL